MERKKKRECFNILAMWHPLLRRGGVQGRQKKKREGESFYHTREVGGERKNELF